jgi:cytochrome c
MSNGPDYNKIFAGICMAALVASLTGFLSNKLVHPEYPKEKGFAIEVPEHGAGESAEAAAPAGAEPIEPLMAAASAENGQKLVRACAACHSFDKGGANRVGPNLYGIIGNKHAHLDNFAYSDAMKAMSAVKWNEEEMNKWLYNPKAYAPGNKMSFAGVSKGKDRADIIAYLKTLKE